MEALYVYTLFDNRTGRPRCTGIKDGDRIILSDLYRPGAGRIIKSIEKDKKIIRKILLLANDRERPIVLSDFKSHIKAFNLPIDDRQYYVYDLHLPDINPTNNRSKDFELIQRILDRMSKSTPQRYQRIISEAAVVYQDLENFGLEVNYNREYPTWSQKTFSGRSKTLGFNIQGLSEPFMVTPPGWPDKSCLVHFDWICADIQVAALMSGDKALLQSFDHSDPYAVMMDAINEESEDKITREECKRYLLKSINSMDFDSAVFEVYPLLGEWMRRCKSSTRGYLESILHRRFYYRAAKNDLAVLNGVMQGSVAHAMQLVVRRAWERLPGRLVAEIHDSLVMVATDGGDVRAVIDIVAPIMMRPFQGVLDANPTFPLKVSIGRRWGEWKLLETHRSSGVIKHAQKAQVVGKATSGSSDATEEAFEESTSS